MNIAGAVFGFIIMGVIIVLWVRAHKSIKGDDAPLFSMGQRKPRKENNSLEEFISAYKRGDVDTGAGNLPAARTADLPRAVPTLAPAPLPSPAAPVPRNAFVSGATKLVYLTCKTGLRDHHVFAHVSLSMLSEAGTSNPALAGSGVDVLICNANFSAVAAIDMIDAGGSDSSAAKSDYLKALGIRYLRLSPKSIPKPDEVHALLYRM